MRSVLLGAVLLLGCGDRAFAQDRIAVLTEPGATVVATELLLTVGPADEDEGKGGLGYLATRAVVAPIRAVLDSLGAHVSITPQKDAISISVVSAPADWQEATRAVVRALFRDPPDSLATLAERRAVVAELRGRTANPADAATREMDRAFFGEDHPWGRPTVGTPASVERLTFRDVDAFLRANFTPDRAFAVVVGAVDEPDAIGHLRPLLGSTFPAPVEMIPFRPDDELVRRDYNSITTWVSASFRFPETGDEEVLRFLAYLATEELSFSPAQRSVYNVWGEVIPRIGGGEIRLQVVIPPEEGEAWAERLEGVMARLLERPMIEDIYAGHLRRFRGQRLMALLAPEDRAHAAARQLLVAGRAERIMPDLTDLTQQRVRAAAQSLGPPTIVLLGPTLDN